MHNCAACLNWEDREGSGVGRCRALPPTCGSSSSNGRFPLTGQNDWCASFRQFPPSEENCSNCNHWAPRQGGMGGCRRYAPRYGEEVASTPPTYWCGEFKERDQ